MAKVERTWVIEGEYFYIPHHKYPGILELYRVDKDGGEHCVQNFCLEESAMALVQEEIYWRKKGHKLSHMTSATRDLNWSIKLKTAKPGVTKGDPQTGQETREDCSYAVSKEEAKKEARRLRRLARKAKEKENDLL